MIELWRSSCCKVCSNSSKRQLHKSIIGKITNCDKDISYIEYFNLKIFKCYITQYQFLKKLSVFILSNKSKNNYIIILFACLKRFDMTCGSEDKKNQIVNSKLDNSNNIIIFFLWEEVKIRDESFSNFMPWCVSMWFEVLSFHSSLSILNIYHIKVNNGHLIYFSTCA